MTQKKEYDIIMAQYVKPTYVKEDMPEKDGNNFFVRLAYGYVEHRLGMDTSQMTTREVIQEFLEAYGASSPADFFKKKFKGGKGAEQEKGEEKKPDAPKEPEKPRLTFEQEKEQMLNDPDRIAYARVITRKKLDEALKNGQNGMGQSTAMLFNQDSFGMGTESETAFYPGSNKVGFVMKDFAWDEDSSYSKSGVFYHECWHAIDNNYGDFEEKTFNIYDATPDERYRYSHMTTQEKQEMYGKKYLSSHYMLSTGKTFHDTLVTEYNTVFTQETLQNIVTEIEQEKRDIFKRKWGMSEQDVRNEFAKYSRQREEIYKTKSLAEYQEFKDRPEFQNLKDAWIELRTLGRYYPEQKRKWGDLSDVVSGATGDRLNLVGMHHYASYWHQSKYNRGIEAFAEIASSKATNPESYALFKKYLPNTVKAFEEIYSKLEKGEIKQNGNRKRYHK